LVGDALGSLGKYNCSNGKQQKGEELFHRTNI
jgi:hypothetical protein